MLEPKDRVFLISGANRGIGAAIARRLAAAGCRLSLGARNPETLVDTFGPETEVRHHFRYDATDRASFAPWVDGTLAAFGRIDGLINNAGASSRFSIEQGDESDLDALWAVNVKGPLFMRPEDAFNGYVVTNFCFLLHEAQIFELFSKNDFTISEAGFVRHIESRNQMIPLRARELIDFGLRFSIFERSKHQSLRLSKKGVS